MKNTTGRGELSEWEIALALTRAGKDVLRPLSTGLRYDLALDNGDGSITRIQCKTAIRRGDVILFRTYNADARRPQGIRYHGQVDAFGVFCPQTRQVFLVPIAALTTMGTAYLRVAEPKYDQK